MKLENGRHAAPIGLAALAVIIMGCFVLALSCPVAARIVPIWSPADLWEKADLVVIGTVKSTQDAKNQQFDHPKGDTLVAVETVFDAHALLKGSLKENILTLRHYRYFGTPEGVLDGPKFVEFNVQKKNSYLMFLKRTADGLYEPLTGQTDPYQSFILFQPYDITEER